MAAVFFDVDGTLVRWTDGYGAVLETAVERELERVDGAWLDHYNDRFFEHFGGFADDPYRRAFGDVCGRFDLDASPERLASALVDAEFAAVEPVPGVERAVRSLADRHTLGLLTNGLPEVQFGKVERVGLGDAFDVRVASHDPDVRATKPGAPIFEAARERVESERLVMVGDNRESDIEGARRHGFEAVHVDSETSGLSAPDFETLATLL